MDCLRSFSLVMDSLKNFSTAGSNVKTWGVIGNQHWIINEAGFSIFNVTGYKRIDLYGIALVGNVQSDLGAGNGVTVDDWGFEIQANAIRPIVGGSFGAPNFWNVSQNINRFQLSKYTPSVMFETPYSGFESIQINNFFAQGQNAETPNSIDLSYFITLTFYYKFEGE